MYTEHVLTSLIHRKCIDHSSGCHWGPIGAQLDTSPRPSCEVCKKKGVAAGILQWFYGGSRCSRNSAKMLWRFCNRNLKTRFLRPAFIVSSLILVVWEDDIRWLWLLLTCWSGYSIRMISVHRSSSVWGAMNEALSEPPVKGHNPLKMKSGNLKINLY